MPAAEIITIGTEILLGEILDTNARAMAVSLREAGIDLYRKTTVGDNAGRIAAAIQEALDRYEIVIATGGLGPTVDDPTREAVAQAMGVENEFRPELWEQIEARFRRFNRQPTENNRRQAFVPQGALAVENPVGTAPAFIMEIGKKCVIALPGVPSEMAYLLKNAIIPYLRHRYQISGMIKSRILHTAGVGESQIDDLIGDLESLSNPTVGLAAHSGQVDARITAKADSEVEADELIHSIEVQLRQRLGTWIYGADQDTLEAAALRNIQNKGWKLAVVEAGVGGELSRRLVAAHAGFQGGEVLPELPALDELLAITDSYRQQRSAEVGLGVAIYPGEGKQLVHFVIITPLGQQQFSRPYGGPPEYAPRWALHHGLDILRQL
jgi:nicotinamide-nucleotide amidase